MKVDHQAHVTEIIEQYFRGLYQGDSQLLRGLFSDDCLLKAPGKRRTLMQWLTDVKQRPCPQELGHDYKFEILSIEIIGQQAMVKVYCPLLGHEYIDYLGLLFEQGRWEIVNKMYAENEEEQICHS